MNFKVSLPEPAPVGLNNYVIVCPNKIEPENGFWQPATVALFSEKDRAETKGWGWGYVDNLERAEHPLATGMQLGVITENGEIYPDFTQAGKDLFHRRLNGEASIQGAPLGDKDVLVNALIERAKVMCYSMS